MCLNDRERLQLVPPPEDDRFFVYLPQVHLDAGFELGFGRNTYPMQQGLGHLPKEGFDQVQPRTVGGREDEFKPVGHGGQKGPRLSGNVCGVIVEHHTNASPRRIMGVRQAQEFDEFGTAMTVAHQTQDLSIPQIDARQQGQRAMADVLMIAAHRRVLAGYRRPVRSGVLQGLDPRLLVVRQHRRQLRGNTHRVPDLHLLVHMQNLFHLGLKVGIALLQIIADLMRLNGLGAQNLGHRSARKSLQAGMTSSRAMLPHMLGQQAGGPQFLRVTQLLGLLASQGYHPSAPFRAQRLPSASAGQILQRRAYAQFEGLGYAALDPGSIGTEHSGDRRNRLARMIAQQNLCPLYPPGGFGARLRQLLQPGAVLFGEFQFRASADKWHGCDLPAMAMSPAYTTTYSIATLFWNQTTSSGATE